MPDSELPPRPSDVEAAALGPPEGVVGPPEGGTTAGLVDLGPPVAYPQSHATTQPILEELDGVASSEAASFYLDTVESMGNFQIFGEDITNGEDHTQGLARTQRLSDGSIYWFLSYSDTSGQGSLSQYRYAGSLDDEHVVQTSPLTVAPMAQLLTLDDEWHPSDITFLPEVNGADAGYLLVTEEMDRHLLAVYRWAPGQDLSLQGYVGTTAANAGDPPPTPLPTGGPNFVFVDLVDGEYLLGVASNNWGLGYLYTADPARLFPSATPGQLDVAAFAPSGGTFPFPLLGGPCQCKLVRDATGAWSLLAFRGDPDDSETATDYVDLYPVQYPPLVIGARQASVHVFFPAGDTSFASTGTHYVEPSGRLLVSSSYRWAEDEGPGTSGYVTRVDELPDDPVAHGPGGGGGGQPVGPNNPPHQLE